MEKLVRNSRYAISVRIIDVDTNNDMIRPILWTVVVTMEYWYRIVIIKRASCITWNFSISTKYPAKMCLILHFLHHFAANENSCGWTRKSRISRTMRESSGNMSLFLFDPRLVPTTKGERPDKRAFPRYDRACAAPRRLRLEANTRGCDRKLTGDTAATLVDLTQVPPFSFFSSREFSLVNANERAILLR